MPRDRYVAAAQFPVRKKVGEYRASARVPNVKGSFCYMIRLILALRADAKPVKREGIDTIL